MSWSHKTDFSKLVLRIDGVKYDHQLICTEGDADVKVEDQGCETCSCSEPGDPHSYGPEDEKKGRGFSYWYDLERRNFVAKHKGQGTSWYGSDGLSICSMCIATMLDNIDSGVITDVTYSWRK